MDNKINTTYVTKVINNFNEKYGTRGTVNIESIKNALRLDALILKNNAQILSTEISEAWRKIAIPAATAYAAKSYSVGEEPDYFAFISHFDMLIKSLLVVFIPALERASGILNGLTYGGRQNIDNITSELEKIDFQERNPRIPIEKYGRMLSKAHTDAKKTLGIHRKIVESVNNGFKLDRMPKLQKLEYLLILDEYIKARFSQSSVATQRITDQDDYKACVEAMCTLKRALNSDTTKDVKSIALSTLTPHMVNFREIRRRMLDRMGDARAIEREMAEFRREINRTELGIMTSMGKDTSIKIDVAKIISRLETKEK